MFASRELGLIVCRVGLLELNNISVFSQGTWTLMGPLPLGDHATNALMHAVNLWVIRKVVVCSSSARASPVIVITPSQSRVISMHINDARAAMGPSGSNKLVEHMNAS